MGLKTENRSQSRSEELLKISKQLIPVLCVWLEDLEREFEGEPEFGEWNFIIHLFRLMNE